QPLEPVPLGRGYLAGALLKDGLIPAVLLDEFLGHPFAARAPELDVHETGSEDSHVPASAHDITRDDPLAAVAPDARGFHKRNPLEGRPPPQLPAHGCAIAHRAYYWHRAAAFPPVGSRSAAAPYAFLPTVKQFQRVRTEDRLGTAQDQR